MATILKRATKAILRWNELKTDADLIINYFNQGSFFAINREEYDTWKKTWEEQGKPKDFEIHSYVGLVPRNNELRLALFFIDSYTDTQPVKGNKKYYNQQLKQSIYKRTLKGTIAITFKGYNAPANGFTAEEAMSRIQSWKLYKGEWLKTLLSKKPNDMVQLFRIPFQDLVDLFETTQPIIKDVILQMGLIQNENDQTLDLDMVLWSQKIKEGVMGFPRDFIQPCPPYCGDKENQYNLLYYALEN